MVSVGSVLITNEYERFQFFFPYDLLHGVALVQGLMAINIEYLMGNTKAIDGLEVK